MKDSHKSLSPFLCDNTQFMLPVELTSLIISEMFQLSLRVSTNPFQVVVYPSHSKPLLWASLYIIVAIKYFLSLQAMPYPNLHHSKCGYRFDI